MAYLAFQDLGGAPAAHVLGQVAAPAADPARLSALEWTVVSLARRDGLSSLRPDHWLTKTLDMLFQRRKPRLADDRLEALRRMAVLTWADGYAVPPYEVRAFLAAGFSERQYEAMVDRVSIDRTLAPRTVGMMTVR